MGRITQLISYLNTDSKKLTSDWIKTNLSHIEITDGLKRCRKDWNKERKTLNLHKSE